MTAEELVDLIFDLMVAHADLDGPGVMFSGNDFDEKCKPKVVALVELWGKAQEVKKENA